MRYIKVVCIILFVIGCEGEQGPAGPHPNGTIKGWVSLYDDRGHYIKEKNDVSITLDKTELSAISLSNGSWEINDVPAGIYNLFFRKDNFFTVKVRNVQFVGGGSYYLGEISIREIPSVYVTKLEASNDQSGPNINFKISTSAPDSVDRHVNILFSVDSVNSPGLVEYIFSSETLMRKNLVNNSSAIIINEPQYALLEWEKVIPCI